MHSSATCRLRARRIALQPCWMPSKRSCRESKSLTHALGPLVVCDPLVHRADQANHGALILGPPVHSWRLLAPSTLAVRLEVDGKILCEAVGGNSAVDPIRLLVWLVNEGSHSLGGVRAGQVVTTGSRTGTIFVNPGTSARATFPELGTVEIKIS